jgi:hypothetical protein
VAKKANFGAVKICLFAQRTHKNQMMSGGVNCLEKSVFSSKIELLVSLN